MLSTTASSSSESRKNPIKFKISSASPESQFQGGGPSELKSVTIIQNNSFQSSTNARDANNFSAVQLSATFITLAHPVTLEAADVTPTDAVVLHYVINREKLYKQE